MQYGYARLSTFKQNMNLQMDACPKAGYENICRSEQLGASDDRAGLSQAIEALEEGDSLTVWRLNRSMRTLIDILVYCRPCRQSLPLSAMG